MSKVDPSQGFDPQTLWCDIHHRFGHSTDWCFDNPNRSGGPPDLRSWCTTCNRSGHTADSCYATSIRIPGKGKGKNKGGKSNYGNRAWKSQNFPAAYNSDQANPVLHDVSSSSDSQTSWWDDHELGSVILHNDSRPNDDHEEVDPVPLHTALLDDYVARLVCSTSAGKVNTEFHLEENKGKYTYSGALVTDKLNLDKILGMEGIASELNLTGKIEGNEFDFKNMKTKLVFSTHNGSIAGYEIDSIGGDILLDKQTISGPLGIKDQYGNLDAYFNLDLSDTIKKYGLKGDFKDLDLKHYGLVSEPIYLTTILDLQLEGDNLDGLNGKIKHKWQNNTEEAFDFEFEIEYKKNNWFPLINGILPAEDEQGFSELLGVEKSWSEFPKNTHIGWRGPFILWDDLKKLDKVYII
jgi:hypothetical protein